MELLILLFFESILVAYRASIPEFPEIMGYGKNWDSALRALKQIFNLKRRVYKLEAMLEHGKNWKTSIPVTGMISESKSGADNFVRRGMSLNPLHESICL